MIFVTGMFRSGTTFVARLLNQHPEIAFASDPFFALFKDFRNTLAEKQNYPLKTSMPLEDYYFTPEANSFFKRLQNTGLDDVKIPDPDFLRKFIEDSSRPYSPLLAEKVPELAGTTYGDFLRHGVRLISEVYGPAPFPGFKEVWANEFVPHLRKIYGEQARFIHIVRDPRSVLVSNFFSEGRYPLFFLGRQWRKLAALSHHYSSEYSNSFVVRYEDLIGQPEKTVRKLCDFLGVDFSEQMLRTDQLKDGGNAQWTQNSTFAEKSEGFNKDSIDRWREKISVSDQKAIETLCYPEMKLLGYEPEAVKTPELTSMPASLFNDDAEKLAGWIKPFSVYDCETETQREKSRNLLLRGTAEKEIIERNFLSEDVFISCKKFF